MTNLLTDAFTTGSGELDGVSADEEEGLGEEENQDVIDIVRCSDGSRSDWCSARCCDCDGLVLWEGKEPNLS